MGKETKKIEKKTKKESIEGPQNLIQVLRNTEKTEKKCAERPRDLIQVSKKTKRKLLGKQSDGSKSDSDFGRVQV